MPDFTNSASFGGSSPYGSQWDPLPLDCNGKTIGNTGTEELRRIFHKFGIEQSHTAARDLLCARYASLLKQIGGQASDKAIMEFLDKHKDMSGV